MDFNKPMDVSSFDWDDTALIRAYDRVMKGKKTKNSKAKKENAKEEKSGKHWQVGDYCRAMYMEDGLFYEAVIHDIQDDVCFVEFLGYGNVGEALLDHLEDSLGKKARQKQRINVKKQELATYTTDTDYSNTNDVKGVNKAPKPGPLPKGQAPAAEQRNHVPSAGYAQHSQQANVQHSQQANMQHSNAPPTAFHPNASHAPVQRMVGPAPPPPPLPASAAASNDPSMSAMLVSWYMAGYYTGVHQKQKSSCCCQHVPNHFNH